LRRLLSFVLFITALGGICVFAALFSVRYFGDPGEVSQVFHLSQSVALGGDNYIGFYKVAITPHKKIAQICELVAWTPERYVNMLERRVWLWPVYDPLFAYEESVKSRALMWAALLAAVFLPVVSVYLWRREE
jgi:hypothetical protein